MKTCCANQKILHVVTPVYIIITLVLFQGAITNILEENVVQPLLVSTSAIHLATETVKSIMKIDDIVSNCTYLT